MECSVETMLVMLLHFPVQLGAVQGQLGERDLALCTLREQLKAAE